VKRAIYPEGAKEAAIALGLSPGIISGDHVFLSGITGSGPDGSMPTDASMQFTAAFEKIGFVLQKVGLTHAAIVELTSYHIDIATYFDTFQRIHRKFLAEPFPAWTAIEVAGLRREGALVEIRVVATMR